MAKYVVTIFASGTYDVEVESDSDPSDGEAEVELKGINKLSDLIAMDSDLLVYEIIDVRELND